MMMDEHPDLETLSAYGERELAGARHARVETHLAQCASCRADLARVRALVDAAAGLPRDVDPPDMVWQGIRSRLARERRPRRRWIAMASLAVAAGLVLVAGTTLLRPGRSEKVMSPAGPARIVTPASVAAVERSYQGSISELRATLDEERQSLSPATIRVLERTLAVIDAAIAEAKTALAADPGNQALTDILSAQYEQKVGLLQRATKLSPST
jgi:predicted anti-sigma-YlaC factor YlaD